MRHTWNATKYGFARLWQGLREWSGDAAYEKYRECVARRGVEIPLSPAEFYVEQLNKKYTRPTRCC